VKEQQAHSRASIPASIHPPTSKSSDVIGSRTRGASWVVWRAPRWSILRNARRSRSGPRCS